MKKMALFLCLSMGTSTLSAQDGKVDKDAISYIIGRNIGGNLSSAGYEFNFDKLLEGIKSGINNTDSPFSEEQMAETIQLWQKEMSDMEESKEESKKATIEVANNEFLEGNKKQAGVIETPSGLQYEIISETQGDKPKASDNVKVHYEGRLTDGTVFDSSIKRGEPITFPLGGVIAGWTEGVQLMSVGSKFRFTIPPKLGYGYKDVSVIPGGSVLIFDVELLEINPQE